MTHENIAINEKVFVQDSAKADDRAREIIKQMLDGNCRVINIKQALRAKGIHLSSVQICYQIKQIVGVPVDKKKSGRAVAGGGSPYCTILKKLI